MSTTLDILASASLWAAVLRIATPLIFGVLGALICERAGVLNLGIEGIMTMGAMSGWLTVYWGGSLWFGLLAAALTGMAFGWLHGKQQKKKKKEKRNEEEEETGPGSGGG